MWAQEVEVSVEIALAIVYWPITRLNDASYQDSKVYKSI